MPDIVVLPAQDVFDTIRDVKEPVTTTILDPWYNKGVGGVREEYEEWLAAVASEAGSISTHIFIWGFPEIVHFMLDRLPHGFELVAWLTWYYKNCPSVIRGWRSAQLACLHIARHGAKLFPQHFLNGAQLEMHPGWFTLSAETGGTALSTGDEFCDTRVRMDPRRRAINASTGAALACNASMTDETYYKVLCD